MARIKFTPTAVSHKATRVILTDAEGSKLTLLLPSADCAQIVFAALRHNLPTGETE